MAKFAAMTAFRNLTQDLSENVLWFSQLLDLVMFQPRLKISQD